MIWVYAVARKRLHKGKIVSLKELEDFSRKVDWLWVDWLNPDEEENTMISDHLGVKPEVLEGIGNKQTRQSCERYRGLILISIPFVEYGNTLQKHFISLILKEQNLVTLRDEHSTRLVERVGETLGNYMEENGPAQLSFVISRLFREVADQNSKAMISLKEQIDLVEEAALEKPGDKSITRSVLKLKKDIFTLHRLLWSEKELMSDMRECVIPHIKLDEEARLISEDATDDINRELEFLNSYGGTLDGILRLQDLGLIHRVEKTLIYLTAVVILLNIILIVLGINK